MVSDISLISRLYSIYFMKSLFRPIVLVLTPLLLLPLIIIYPTSLAKCAYVLILMATYWVTEALHLSVTSLLPILLLPLLGVLDSERVTMHYFTNTNMLFLGSLIVARAIEHCNLHKRIALFILKKFGTNTLTLILGFMLPTWFMSMWISNVAATSMGDSIAQAVIAEMERWADDQEGRPEGTLEFDDRYKNHSNLEKRESQMLLQKRKSFSKPPVNPHFAKLATGISLSIAYSATCGGIATLTGTGPNLILEGLIVGRYGEASGLNFGSYMAFATPISLFCLFFTWMWICVIFIGPRKMWKTQSDNSQKQRIKNMLFQEYAKLGKMSFSELSCIVWLFILIALWITRNPGYSLWNRLFVYQQIDGSFTSFATDTQPVILVAIIFLSWPMNNPFSRAYWTSGVNIDEVAEDYSIETVDQKYRIILRFNDKEAFSWSIEIVKVIFLKANQPDTEHMKKYFVTMVVVGHEFENIVKLKTESKKYQQEILFGNNISVLRSPEDVVLELQLLSIDRYARHRVESEIVVHIDRIVAIHPSLELENLVIDVGNIENEADVMNKNEVTSRNLLISFTSVYSPSSFLLSIFVDQANPNMLAVTRRYSEMELTITLHANDSVLDNQFVRCVEQCSPNTFSNDKPTIFLIEELENTQISFQICVKTSVNSYVKCITMCLLPNDTGYPSVFQHYSTNCNLQNLVFLSRTVINTQLEMQRNITIEKQINQ